VEQSEIELEYERRWKAMSPAEKVARSAAMFAWTRQQMALRIRNTQPSLSDEEVRLHVALQLYERDPEVVRLIQQRTERIRRNPLTRYAILFTNSAIPSTDLYG
jgi:hypothetical protein